MEAGVPQDLQAFGVLDDAARWRIYWLLRQAGRPLTRQEVADRTGLPARVATFHLERLLGAGLLTTYFARPPGRSGPGAGRSAKYYRPAAVQLDLSIPERRYAFVGELLVEALQAAEHGERPSDATPRLARERGRAIRREAVSGVSELLVRLGYEPYRPVADVIGLRNCPFHTLAQQAPELVCALHSGLLQGILEGVGDHMTQALLAVCNPGDCCVTLQRSPVLPLRPRRET